MTSQIPNSPLTQQYLRDEYLSALNDLTTAFDSCAASFHILRRVAALVGSSAGFLGLTTRRTSPTRETPVVAAHTGSLFTGAETFSELQGLAADHGWTDTENLFRKDLARDTVLPERILIGYPLFDQLGNHIGVLMLVVYSEESIRILETVCPLLIHLLIHRIQEFNLVNAIRESGSQNAREILAVRGSHFPALADLINKGLHDINGQLAIGSLQLQVFKNKSAPVHPQELGFKRIEQSLVHIGEKISAQEDLVTLLLHPETVCSFIESFELAVTTFGQGLKIQVEFETAHQISRNAVLPLRGNVAYWIFHNILRGVASVYQWIPETLNGPIRVETTARTLPDRDSPGLAIHLPSHPLLLEYLAEITSPLPSALTQRSLPGLVALLRETLVSCGGDISFSENGKMVDIIVGLPVPQLATHNDGKRTLQ